MTHSGSAIYERTQFQALVVKTLQLDLQIPSNIKRFYQYNIETIPKHRFSWKNSYKSSPRTSEFKQPPKDCIVHWLAVRPCWIASDNHPKFGILGYNRVPSQSGSTRNKRSTKKCSTLHSCFHRDLDSNDLSNFTSTVVLECISYHTCPSCLYDQGTEESTRNVQCLPGRTKQHTWGCMSSNLGPFHV